MKLCKIETYYRNLDNLYCIMINKDIDNIKIVYTEFIFHTNVDFQMYKRNTYDAIYQISTYRESVTYTKISEKYWNRRRNTITKVTK